jgi:hypothetical protein
MEMKIFNHILFDSLMPWLVKSADTSRMNECLKEAGKISPATLQDLSMQVTKLLSNKASLTTWLQKQTASSEKLKPLSYSTDLPDYTDTPTKYYTTLIDAESQRIYNSYLAISDKYATDEDLLSYHTVNALRNLKHYIVTTSKEIRVRELEYNNGNINDLTTFVLFYLKYKLIVLYFSIQLVNKDILETAFELEDFYLMELNETKANVHQIYQEQSTVKPIKEQKGKRLAFGFTGKPEKIKAIINALCAKVQLLDESRSPAELLIQLLQSKDIKPGKVKIYLDCDNKNFRYIIDKLSHLYFDNLSFINMEHSQSFYSKKGTLLTSNSFSKAATSNPKAKEEIDKIFQQLQ